MGLENDGGLKSDGEVFSVGVVVKVDVGKESVLAQVHSGKATLEHLGFEGADEGLGPGVVIRIGARGHALAHPALAQELPVSGAAILAAAVTVEDKGGEMH